MLVVALNELDNKQRLDVLRLLHLIPSGAMAAVVAAADRRGYSGRRNDLGGAQRSGAIKLITRRAGGNGNRQRAA